MALQAFIDDSVERDRVLVLAGYIATEDQWTAFERDWQANLDHAKWPYFKMAEVHARRVPQEFIAWFYRTIEKHAPFSVSLALELEPLEQALVDLGFKAAFGKEMRSPYVWAHRALIENLASRLLNFSPADRASRI
jgi:hypothetical protein